jgi:hypothetical protein
VGGGGGRGGGAATGRLGWAAKERRGVQSRGGVAAIGVGTGQGGPAGSGGLTTPGAPRPNSLWGPTQADGMGCPRG